MSESRHAAEKHRAQNETREPVTVIGLGLMGSALARAFLEAGHPTTVWNRSSKKADSLVTQGAKLASTPKEAVSGSRLVVVCVFDDDAVRDALEPLSSSLAGRTIVNLTSSTPKQARETAVWMTAAGADYVDGAIMAVPQGIGRPESVIFYSGSHRAFEAHERTLGVLGTSHYFGADAGMAALYDFALLGVMWSAISGFLHSVALLETEKVSATSFLPMVTPWLGTIGTFLPDMARDIDRRHYETDVSTLALNAAGLDMLVSTSREQGIGVDVPAPIAALFRRRVAAGHGGEGIASLIESIRRPASEQ
ncbi:MAG: NAD(P)-dependent oxidoreductase [Polyangiaceae bacterium]|nr:NAD(P)-dependent oxidoreductase [Polyangiaceae bacterium]